MKAHSYKALDSKVLDSTAVAGRASAAFFSACALVIFSQSPIFADSKNPAKQIPLDKIARATLINHFSAHPKTLSEMVKSYAIPEIYKKRRGLFVTLSKEGKTRACWGSVMPQEGNLVAGTIVACEEALSKEYRFATVRRSEVPELKCQVTVIEKMEPIGPHAVLSPMVDGLMVRSGGRAAVLLPGEASDPHYQVMQCKLKAGINPKQPCQMYRMRAHVFR